MAKLKSGDKLDAAMKARAALDAEIKELQAAARERQRATEERRFLVMGRTVCAHIAVEPDGTLARATAAVLDQRLTRAADRSLFDFLAKQPSPDPT